MAVQRLSNSGRSGFSYKSLIAGITPLPSVPTIGAATAVNFESVNVAFTAPGAYAGSTFTATSSPGGLTATSATSPILVTGLSESTAYTFTVTATNATGTSGASAASDPVTTPAGDLGVMFPIQMVSVGAAGASTISFTSIPSTYKHLEIRYIVRADVADFDSALLMRFNSVTASDYSWHLLRGSGSSFYADGAANNNNPLVASQVGNDSLANVYGAGTISVLDYANTNKYKTGRAFGGFDVNGSGGYLQLASQSWRSNTAISSIQLTFSTGSGFRQYSQFALYGIK